MGAKPHIQWKDPWSLDRKQNRPAGNQVQWVAMVARRVLSAANLPVLRQTREYQAVRATCGSPPPAVVNCAEASAMLALCRAACNDVIRGRIVDETGYLQFVAYADIRAAQFAAERRAESRKAWTSWAREATAGSARKAFAYVKRGYCGVHVHAGHLQRT